MQSCILKVLRCCAARKKAAADISHATVAADYFTASRVAIDTAVDVAINAAKSAELCAEQAHEAVKNIPKALKDKPEDEWVNVELSTDTTQAELARSKSA